LRIDSGRPRTPVRSAFGVAADVDAAAAELESTGVEGRIQVPEDVHERLKGEFVFEERGDIAVKGKGVLHTWFLVGYVYPKQHSSSSPHTPTATRWRPRGCCGGPGPGCDFL
jgi:class 3 adenylate cyclase